MTFCAFSFNLALPVGILRYSKEQCSMTFLVCMAMAAIFLVTGAWPGAILFFFAAFVGQKMDDDVEKTTKAAEAVGYNMTKERAQDGCIMNALYLLMLAMGIGFLLSTLGAL
jgi:hypothetical protein